MATTAWIEIAEDSWYRRTDPWDVNVGVVRGADGLCLIDTRGSHRQGEHLVDDLRSLGAPVVAVVNSHWHFDHTWGNAVFARTGARVWGHHTVPAAMSRWFEEVRDSLSFAHPDAVAELAEVECVPPDRLVDPTATIDLGDREVEVRFLGRGHTDGDVVVTTSSASVLFAGDLVEEAGPPAYGDDSHPLDWPGTARALLGNLGATSVVVPGHGNAVDRPFCIRQADEIREVAETLRDLHRAGVSRKEALAEGSGHWPYPVERLGEAVLRGYDHLDATTSAT